MNGGRARWAGRGVLGLFVLLLAMNGLRIGRNLGLFEPIGAGDLAPSFSLPRIGEGGEVGPEEVALEDLRGEVVVVDFWATWCKPCREAMPVLERTRRAYADRDLVVLSINTEGAELAAEARQMISRLAPSVTLLSDDGRVADRYKVSTIPHLVVIDRRGVVRLVHRGFNGTAALEEMLSESLGQLLGDP